MRGLDLAFTNPGRSEGVVNVCLCLGCGSVGGVGGDWVVGMDQGWRSGVVLYMCDM